MDLSLSDDAEPIVVSVQPGGALEIDDRRVWQRSGRVAFVADAMHADPAIAAALAVLTPGATTRAGAAQEVHLLDRRPSGVWPERWILFPPLESRGAPERTVALDVVYRALFRR